MFKNIDKRMMLKLALLHVVVITISNALVSIPVEIAGIKLTWAAFTFPLVILATDLTVRMLGKHIARATIVAAYPIAIIASIAVVMAEGAPQSVALRIGLASATAYAVGTMLDVYVFQYFRENWSRQWWIAPALSTVVANVIDSYTFFAVAFNNSADEYMAANWMEIATSQAGLKIAVGLIIFLPAYGVLLRYINGTLGDVKDDVFEPVIDVVVDKPKAKAPAKVKVKAKAKAPAKTGGKKAGELSMTPTAIKQREARAKAKAKKAK